MATFAYHASHEQFTPSQLLSWSKQAAVSGFDEIASSDHLMPWSNVQGESGFAWSWLGAILEATTVPVGVVTAPVERYHPVIIAQACATLTQMYPERFWVSMGSGEALNEHITGARWPGKTERNERLFEAVSVIRRLWAGERISLRGKTNIEEAQLYTLPPSPLSIMGAAISESTAEWMGSWVDGLYTLARPHEELAKVVAAFRRGGGEGKPIFLKVQVSCAPDPAESRSQALEQWSSNVAASSIHAELKLPEEFESIAKLVRPEDIEKHVRIDPDPAQHVAWLQEDLALGFEKIVLHNVGVNQEYFINFYGSEVLPNIR